MSKFKVGDLVYFVEVAEISCREILRINDDGDIYVKSSTRFNEYCFHRSYISRKRLFKTKKSLITHLTNNDCKDWEGEEVLYKDKEFITKFFMHEGKIKEGLVFSKKLVRRKVMYTLQCSNGDKFSKLYNELYSKESDLIDSLRD